jgi:16S rRNA (guanine966-N2)-methyltransferase
LNGIKNYNSLNMKGKIRIIGGIWRGRKLEVPDKSGLRPTPDRVRETLFNWLAMHLPESRCLDLFAGSGALGIEAISRGAKQAILVEKEYDIVQSLKEQVTVLATNKVEIICANALAFLKKTASAFDIVFLDPPFDDSDLLIQSCILLEQQGWLNPHALMYLEMKRGLALPNLPDNWQIIRQQTAGKIAFFLVARH